jgi:hypothetical protein
VSDEMMMSSEEPIVPEGTVAPLPAPPMIKPGMAKRNVLLIVAGVIVLVALVGFVAYAMILAGNVAAPGGGTPVATPGMTSNGLRGVKTSRFETSGTGRRVAVVVDDGVVEAGTPGVTTGCPVGALELPTRMIA